MNTNNAVSHVLSIRCFYQLLQVQRRARLNKSISRVPSLSIPEYLRWASSKLHAASVTFTASSCDYSVYWQHCCGAAWPTQLFPVHPEERVRFSCPDLKWLKTLFSCYIADEQEVYPSFISSGKFHLWLTWYPVVQGKFCSLSGSQIVSPSHALQLKQKEVEDILST